MIRLLFFGLVLFTGGCKPSIQSQAKEAAVEYCDCLQMNLFLFPKAQKLYNYCTTKLEKKYRLLEIYFKRIENIEYSFSLAEETKDSVNKFMGLFRRYSDSCAIPTTEKPGF